MAKAETISIVMTPNMARAVRESVEAGAYASTSDVMREADQLWPRQHLEDAERLDSIRARIRRSLNDPRPDLSCEEVRAHIQMLVDEAEKTHRDRTS